MVTDGEFELPTWSALPAQPNEEFDEVARTLAERLSVPMAFVILVSKAGQVFPGAFGLPAAWNARRSSPLTGSPSQRVTSTGRSVVIRDVREDPLLRENLPLRELGVVAYAGAALSDVQGRPLGVLCAADVRQRDWSPADTALLERLAAQCSGQLQLQALQLAGTEALSAAERAATAAQQTAYAAQAALEEAEAEADRARVVARLGAALMSAETFEDVLWTVDRFLRSPLGAAGTVLGLTEAGSSSIRAWPTGLPDAGREGALGLDDRHPLAEAVREHRLVTVASREEAEQAFPGLPDAGYESVVVAPLVLGQHASTGALLVGWSGRRELDPAVRTVVLDLARQVGLAVDRVLLVAARARLERSLPARAAI